MMDIESLLLWAKVYEIPRVECVGCGKKYYLIKKGECYCENCGAMLPDGEVLGNNESCE